MALGGGTTLGLSPLVPGNCPPSFQLGGPHPVGKLGVSLSCLRSTGQVLEFLEDHWPCYCGWDPSPPRTLWVFWGRQPSCCMGNGSSAAERLPALGLTLGFSSFSLANKSMEL